MKYFECWSSGIEKQNQENIFKFSMDLIFKTTRYFKFKIN